MEIVDPPLMLLTVSSSTENSTNLTSAEEDWAPQYNTSGAIATIASVCIIMVVIIFGNSLTIAAVLTQKNLQQLQNWFIVSLAVADLLVGLLIMPLSLSYEVLGRWTFGWVVCELWLALDVLFMTASVLNLCMISLDRYWSVTHAISYRQKRTPRRVLAMIAAAWFCALLISFPPLVGWRPPRGDYTKCELSDLKAYVLYSAMGSFYIPSVVLIVLYARIFKFTRKRANKLLRRQNRSIDSARSPPTPSMTTPSGATPSMIVSRQKSFDIALATRLQHIVPTRRSVRRQESPPKEQTKSLPASNQLVRKINNKPADDYDMKSTLAFIADSYMSIPLSVTQLSSLDDGLDASSSDDDPLRKESTVKFDAQANNVSSIVGGPVLRSVVVTNSIRSTKSSCKESTPLVMDRQKRLQRKEIRATAILGCILFAFIASLLPFFTSYLVTAIFPSVQIAETIFDVFFWLGYCNSAFNPIIYAFVNVEFRKAFKRLLRIDARTMKGTRV